MNKNHLTRIIPYSLFLIPILAFASFDRDLTVGSRGMDVESLQSFLMAQGVYSGPVTGYFGNLTREGVRKFQEKNSISPSAGYFGPKTRAFANKNTDASSVESAPSPVLSVADLQKQIEALTAELQKLQSSSATASSTAEPAVQPPVAVPVAPAPSAFTGSARILSIYPNITLSSYIDIPLNE